MLADRSFLDSRQGQPFAGGFVEVFSKDFDLWGLPSCLPSWACILHLCACTSDLRTDPYSEDKHSQYRSEGSWIDLFDEGAELHTSHQMSWLRCILGFRVWSVPPTSYFGRVFLVPLTMVSGSCPDWSREAPIFFFWKTALSGKLLSTDPSPNTMSTYYAMEKDLKSVHAILHLGVLVAQELIQGGPRCKPAASDSTLKSSLLTWWTQENLGRMLKRAVSK